MLCTSLAHAVAMTVGDVKAVVVRGFQEAPPKVKQVLAGIMVSYREHPSGNAVGREM